MFGWKAPDVPSVRELLFYQVSNDYMGIPEETTPTGDMLLRQMNERLAVSNYIAFRQLEATENTNTQLAIINLNQLAPFNMSGYLNELNSAENKKAGKFRWN